MSLEQLMLLIRHESCLSSFHSCPHWLKALSLFDQQPKMEQQFLSQKFSIGLLSHKIMSLLAPTDQQISKFRNFLLTYLNRSIRIGQQQNSKQQIPQFSSNINSMIYSHCKNEAICHHHCYHHGISHRCHDIHAELTNV
jgi:hypothetical protein